MWCILANLFGWTLVWAVPFLSDHNYEHFFLTEIFLLQAENYTFLHFVKIRSSANCFFVNLTTKFLFFLCIYRSCEWIFLSQKSYGFDRILNTILNCSNYDIWGLKALFVRCRFTTFSTAFYQISTVLDRLSRLHFVSKCHQTLGSCWESFIHLHYEIWWL